MFKWFWTILSLGAPAWILVTALIVISNQIIIITLMNEWIIRLYRTICVHALSSVAWIEVFSPRNAGKERCVTTTACETKSVEHWRKILGSVPKSEITAFALRGSVDHVEMAVSFPRGKR